MFLLPLQATATVELSTKHSLIKSCLGSICLLAVYLIRLWLSPLNLTAPLSQALLRPLQGRGALRDTMKRVTRALTTGVTRGSSHFTEVQESHKASGGIYEGGGKAKGVAREGEWEEDQGTVDAPTLLKAANLEKWQTHTHSHKSTQRCVHKCQCRLTYLNKLIYTNWYVRKDAIILCIYNSHTHLWTLTGGINRCCCCVYRNEKVALKDNSGLLQLGSYFL